MSDKKDYSNKEIEEILKKELPFLTSKIMSCENVNFRPHPFMIGPRHFPKDGGMFIQPEQAPCAMRGCGKSYAEHTSDRVIFVQPKGDPQNNEADKEVLQADLMACIAVMEKFGIKVDGFALIKPEGMKDDGNKVD